VDTSHVGQDFKDRFSLALTIWTASAYGGGFVSEAVPATRIENAILLIRGQKVLLDADSAALYGVETKILVKAVKRNVERSRATLCFSSYRKRLRV